MLAHQWSVRFGGDADDLVRDLAVGADGSVAITGEFRNQLTIGDRIWEAARATDSGSERTTLIDIFVAEARSERQPDLVGFRGGCAPLPIANARRRGGRLGRRLSRRDVRESDGFRRWSRADARGASVTQAHSFATRPEVQGRRRLRAASSRVAPRLSAGPRSRGKPENPQLRKRPAADADGRAGAASRSSTERFVARIPTR